MEKKWEESGIEKAEFSRISSTNFAEFEGQLTGHKLNKKGFADGTIFNILQILYLDDGAFIFSSRNDLVKGVNLINQVFSIFGLEMHVGRNGKASKTEYMFVAPPVFSKCQF